jgi:hypothetical protein
MTERDWRIVERLARRIGRRGVGAGLRQILKEWEAWVSGRKEANGDDG